MGRLVILGYLREIIETATATVTLVESDTPRPAFANARGAFEAARNLLLIRFDDDPPLAAAAAFAGERIDQRRSEQRARNALAEIKGSRPTQLRTHAVDDAIQEDASFLDGQVPTSGQILWDGLALVRDRYAKGRWHWSGLSQEDATVKIDSKLRDAGQTSTAETWTWANDQLSMNTHAQPRCYPPYLEIRESIQFSIPGRDEAEEVAGGALAAAIVAVETALAILPELEALLP